MTTRQKCGLFWCCFRGGFMCTACVAASLVFCILIADSKLATFTAGTVCGVFFVLGVMQFDEGIIIYRSCTSRPNYVLESEDDEPWTGS